MLVEKRYAVFSKNKSEIGVYKDIKGLDFHKESVAIKLYCEEDAQSFIDHGNALLNMGMPFANIIEILKKRKHGKDNKNPIYYVIIGNRHKGVFNNEDRINISSTEKISYQKKFYLKDSAVAHFNDIKKDYQKRYYVVLSSDISGIYTDLELVQRLTSGSVDTVIRSFNSLDQAEEFLVEAHEDYDKYLVSSFVDGSYNSSDNLCGFGFVLVYNGKLINREKGVSLSHNELKHVNGEIEATMNSIIKAVNLGFKKIIIYHDFEGISRWAVKKSKAKKKETRFVADNYRNFIQKMKRYIDIYFIKVKSHDGIYYNEMADMLAKQACGNRLIMPLKHTKKKNLRV
ncbi:ribonuclease H family protein [Bacillus subtilis]|uniref:Reverse transcriptase-like protein n=1 Tax=Bacillus phage vB_BsuS_PJN02 TaxID=2920374 RepID=A0AC61TSC0_9CAUD|nr:MULTISPECIES: viroplasmin family protein [Bacillus subtilis group]YP_010681680.1 Rnase H [Bacillus phage vB_BsuS_PJN02]MCR4361990.1 ribonuclease H family protein [Bacillus subtilis]UNH58405.1 reverse transcriptase-like protein [Bacillus phage vB_BsuS_PJN02]UQB84390.1 ribonuclease H family protein [Bacillus amyloliquefaciens]WOF33029.1 ribonuclease H family protein [Bacillus subtilis]